LRLSYEKETPVRPVRPPPDPGLAYRDLTGRPLQISHHRDGEPVGTVAIALSGEIHLASADQLDAVIRDAEETDIGWIVVDLSDVSFIDSTGLGVLLNAKKRSDGRVSCIPSNQLAVTRLLELTGAVKMLAPD
jgi:anti-sigma B factor antagonist